MLLRPEARAGRDARLLFSHGAPARAAPAFEARSVREFALAPVQPGDALVWRLDDDGTRAAGFGTVRVPESAFLGELVNTGWVAPTPDGGVVFASAIASAVQRYSSDGQLLWISTRVVPAAPSTPRLEVRNGSLFPAFMELQHGIAVGPDDRIYVLRSGAPHIDEVHDSTGANALTTASDDRAAGGSFALDVLDDSGVWQWSARVPRDADVLAARDGRIALAAPPPPPAAPVMPAFDLPALFGAGRVRLDAYRGRIVVLNFWASWCAPCRRELPELDALARTVDPARVAIIGINEDVTPADGRRFLEELGTTSFAHAEGRGRMRERVRYRGLPYTLVLDAQHRRIAEFYGFGESIESIRSAIRQALGAGGATGAS